MSSKLKVEELRSQLSLRGLDSRGTKAMLVKRLESSMQSQVDKEIKTETDEASVADGSATMSGDEKEKKVGADEAAPADGVSNDLGKRKRGSVDPDDGRKKEVGLDKEELKSYTIRELRALAKRRGVSATGTKKELVKKLTRAAEIPQETAQGEEEEPEEIGEEKLVTATKKDGVIVDQRLPDDIESSFHVLQKSEGEMQKNAGADESVVVDGSTLNNRDEEEKKAGADEVAPADVVSNHNGKRKRDSVDSDDGQKEESLDEEKLKKYTVRELKALAGRCGVMVSGTKKELVKRLTAVVDIPKETATQEEEPKEIEEEKLVTATKKGNAILDLWLPDDIKSSFHVLQQGMEIYDATLNQTNVGDNNNKFFVIQALEYDNGGKFMVYCRWGRVGVRGQDKLHGPFVSQQKAITEFEAKFFQKTKNHWHRRKEFVSYPKCYTWLEMDYNEADPKQILSKAIKSVDTQLRETKLEDRVAKFISLICNINMMKQQMLEIGYNAEKLPLGKLSESTILKGYDVLRRISDVVLEGDKKKLEELSGEFYTVIPHDFGFKKMRDFVIDTPFKVKSKLEMVAALGEIEIASKILKDDVNSLEDPLYSHYQQLCCELAPVDTDSSEFSMVQKYINNTHAGTHSNYTVDIIHLFRVSRKGEVERFKQFSNVKNRMLLWHGSRLTNWTGILLQGLRIAPPEAPVTGYMFGKGVYFSDMFSKSANYCFATSNSNAGVMLLCEVALGDMAELLSANYHADLLPEGKLSTKGVGSTEPDISKAEKLEDGLVVPLGKPKKRAGSTGHLLYNEYIVYNVEQIRMRYLIQLNFNYK